MNIEISDYLSNEDIKEIIKERLVSYVDNNIENSIKVAIQYAFYEILPKEYLEKLPAIVDEKIKDISVTDIIGYADGVSFRNSEARNILNSRVRENSQRLAEICLEKFSQMDGYDAKEILVNALTVKGKE